MIRVARIAPKLFVSLSLIIALQLSVVSRVSAPPITYFIVTLRSCDSAGNSKTVFGPGEFVYACGSGYEANEELTLRVMPNDAMYRPEFSVCNKLVKADSLGRLGPVKLCTLAPGEYDIWADRNSDGWLNSGSPRPEPVAGLGCRRGFLVVPEFWLGTILGLAGCFGAFGTFRLLKRRQKNI